LKTPEIYLEPKQRTLKVIELLEKQYPNAKTALNYTNPLEILIATILSAQTTDVTVNIVTQKLFKKYHSASQHSNPKTIQKIPFSSRLRKCRHKRT